MTFEQQYPSPDRCERLKYLKFPMNTTLFMRTDDHTRFYMGNLSEKFCERDYYPCPSVPEMLDLMPKKIENLEQVLHLILTKTFLDLWSCSYVKDFYSKNVINVNKYLANAVADCLIWLVENNFISFKKESCEK